MAPKALAFGGSSNLLKAGQKHKAIDATQSHRWPTIWSIARIWLLCQLCQSINKICQETSNIANKTVSNLQFTHIHVYCSTLYSHYAHRWDKTTLDLTRRSHRHKTFRVGLYNCLLDDFLLTVSKSIHFKQQARISNDFTFRGV